MHVTCAFKYDKSTDLFITIFHKIVNPYLRRAPAIKILDFSQENRILVRVSPENGPQILTMSLYSPASDESLEEGCQWVQTIATARKKSKM